MTTIAVLNAVGGTETIAKITDTGALTAANSLSVVQNSTDPFKVVGYTVNIAASSTITRPANTTAYTAGDLIANSTTAGSVTNLQFTTAARISGGSGMVVSASIQKSSNNVVAAAMRLHLFTVAPTYTSAGDNTSIATVVQGSAKGYIGYIDIQDFIAFSDVAWGTGAANNSRGGLPFVASAQTLFGLVEATGAYTPTSGEVFTVSIQVLQD